MAKSGLNYPNDLITCAVVGGLSGFIGGAIAPNRNSYVYVKGEQGDKGDTGATGPNGSA